MSIENNERSELSLEFPAVLEAARPDIYRQNAFRILGLSIEATPRDLSRHVEKLKMTEKYGTTVANRSLLRLDPPPDANARDQASHKLHDPEKRLIDEIFWFWPRQLGQGSHDDVLANLAQEDVDSIAKQWLEMERSSSSLVSMHNLAVLFHCLALDLEAKALEKPLSASELKKVQEYWSYAFKRWRIVIEQEQFWSRVSARIRSLEDPRLKSGLSRRMQESLPMALLSMNAVLAVQYAGAGRMDDAKRQLEIMKSWGKPGEKSSSDGLSQKALLKALEPIRQRIKLICKSGTERCDADKKHGDQAVRGILEQSKPLLAILDTLLPAGDLIREAIHDDVARTALHCQIDYGNLTENWKVSLELLLLIIQVALGKTLRERIDENFVTVKNNLEFDTCYFCKTNNGVEASDIRVAMYGDVRHVPIPGGTRITWNKQKVRVPRCPECKHTHESIGPVGKGIWAGIGLMVVCIIIGSIFKLGGNWSFLVLFPVIGGVMGKRKLNKQPVKDILPASKQNDHPKIKELLGQGWHFGEEPT